MTARDVIKQLLDMDLDDEVSVQTENGDEMVEEVSTERHRGIVLKTVNELFTQDGVDDAVKTAVEETEKKIKEGGGS